MTIIFEERQSDSPYIETVTRGHTTSAGTTIRPAECHWHVVVMKQAGTTSTLVVGPLSTSGVVRYGEGAELLWIKFKLGAWLPHLPARAILDTEIALPDASSRSFWLQTSRWELPTYDTVETFAGHLAHDDQLLRDPLIGAALGDELPATMPPRTVRHHFLRATGLTQSYIRQLKRAQQASALLRQGVSIPDVLYEAGYYDQPHLTRSLKQFIGHTPAQIIRMRSPE